MEKAMTPTFRKKKKTTGKVGRSVYLDDRIVKAVEAQAVAEDRSFSTTMNRVLRKALGLPQPT